MNSPMVTNNIRAGKDTMLGELLQSTPDNRAVLEVLYLRVLARRPNAKEISVCGRYLESVGNRVEALRGHPLEPAQLDRVHQPAVRLLPPSGPLPPRGGG